MEAFNEETYLKDLDSLKSLKNIIFANVSKLDNEFHSKMIAVIDTKCSLQNFIQTRIKN